MYEAAALYHNQSFDTEKLSHELLFARFAWAIIKQAGSQMKTSLRKRFRLITLNSEAAVNEPSTKEATEKQVINKKRKAEDVFPSDAEASQVNEAQELAEDLKLAKSAAPFFCKLVVSSMLRCLILSSKVEEPNTRKDRYHTMMWYPGKTIMERKMREYMDAHPNIRARSAACPSVPSDDSDVGEENYQTLAGFEETVILKEELM